MEEPRAVFKITGPNLERDEIVVTRGGLTVGRVAGNDLILDHPLISRRHMRFTWQDGAFWVEDLGSRNGTWIGDRRIEPNTPARVNAGDSIRTGPYLFTFEQVEGLEPPAAPEAAAPPPPSKVPEQSRIESEPKKPRTKARPAEPPPAPPPSRVPEQSRIDSPPPLEAREPAAPPSRLPEESKLPPSGPPGPPAPPGNGAYPFGIPRDKSNWLQYLPALYAEDAFIGRYLLVFESVMAPIIWMIDNFDLYLTPQVAPAEWLKWIASWFDLLLLPSLPVERQRALVDHVGWLFLRRGTRAGLERLLELYFGVKPEIIENADRACHFTVKLRLGRGEAALSRAVAERLIESQKPAFAGYALEIS
ncbi:MAG: FHA domain-containing protein [Anaerolineae bacterium]|nr:FHA domain-containing protein [Anaerolineae bacterium]